MGIFDFFKDAGDTGGEDEAFQELAKGNAIIKKMQRLGLPVDGIQVGFDDGTATITGEVRDQATRERLVLAAGNTPGVAHVDDRLRVTGAGAGSGGFAAPTYTVQKGDTLSEIAQERLGDASRWQEIYDANRPLLDDPDRIYPGQVLRMPAA
jgi:nucleoid-associated protein YgaU